MNRKKDTAQEANEKVEQADARKEIFKPWSRNFFVMPCGRFKEKIRTHNRSDEFLDSSYLAHRRLEKNINSIPTAL
jgi:hypothetical protein